MRVTVPTRIGPCYPRCTPTYGPGGSGSRSHRLVNGLLPGVPVVVPDWWDPNDEGLCVWAAYQPKGAADLASSYIDLSGNGNNAGLGVAPTWDAVNGWKFNGVNQYLTTTFIPQNDQSQSVLEQFTNDVLLQAYICGARTGTHYFGCENNTAIGNMRYSNGNITNGVATYAAGNCAVAGNQGYRDGVADGAAIAADATVPAHSLYIGAINWGGVPAGYAQVYIQAVAIYDCTLTAPQVLAVATAMAAL